MRTAVSGQRKIVVALFCATWSGAAMYACGGDDTSGGTGEPDAALDSTSDGAANDRAISDARVQDSEASDSGDDVFLPDEPFICGSSACDLTDSGCCGWFSDDGSTGGECLPTSDFDSAVFPCGSLGQLSTAAFCYRATDCPAPLRCAVAPLGPIIFGQCADAGAGGEFLACDPAHPCESELRCFRLQCGANEIATCLPTDGGASGLLTDCTVLP